MSRKSSSSRIRASSRADSTRASAVGDPYRANRSFSREPAFTPIRMGTPRAFASRAISRTLSWYLMFPGLIRNPCTPASSAAIAYFHWKWMSATTGIVDFAAIAVRASASSQWGTATRTISQPDATNDAICWSVASTFAVFVMVMDWTRTGAPPPPAEHGLTGRDGDGVGAGREQHRLDVRVAVLPFVGFRKVLGPPLQIVVGVVDVLRNQVQHTVPEVLQRTLFPFIDQEGARGVGAERDGRPVGDARVLDGPLQLLGQIEVGVSCGRRHLDGDGR